MPTLLDFRRRIRSVKNTQQITKAMKFVAAARLRRAQERALAARHYANCIRDVVESAALRIENPTHPLLGYRESGEEARPAPERVLVLVLTGERGLCGAFNTNVLRRATELLRELRAAGKSVELIPIGKKGRDSLRKQKWTLVAEYINVLARVEEKTAREIAAQAIERYSSGEAGTVYAVYNEFKSVLTQKLTVAKLLPIELEARARASSAPAHGSEAAAETQVDYLYEQPAAEILNRLLPRYVETQVFRAMLESSASEHAARMTAMDSATNNAGELIERLTLYMNKVRQAAITKEILEVVSGAASTA